MRKHTQTTFGGSDKKPPHLPTVGNCWQTAVACVLDLEITAVPHFMTYEKPWIAYEKFLKDCGFINWAVRAEDIERMPDNLVGIGVGKNSEGVGHMVVWKGHSMWHDPNPHKKGFDVSHVDYFIPIQTLNMITYEGVTDDRRYK